MKPFSPASERNRAPILEVLRHYFTSGIDVLEIGAGTGQHAEYFADALPHLHWLPTDIEPSLSAMRSRIDDAQLSNLAGPIELDVTASEWPVQRADHVFSANTAHIMSWAAVTAMFRGVTRVLSPGGFFVLYGPFKRAGTHTSDSNRLFDEALRAQDPDMGIRDDRALIDLALGCGLVLEADVPMPANNRILVWRHS